LDSCQLYPTPAFAPRSAGWGRSPRRRWSTGLPASPGRRARNRGQT